jgi:conjugative relaxase-like TrwC/TraI family protein
MLRVVQSTSQAQAQSYYTTDYYSEGQELAGRWGGTAAERLGLAGEVKQGDWAALCDNRHPLTGAKLSRRRNKERTQGYDFNFHVPKSVSLLYAETRDGRILDAMRESVEATMQDIESEMATRVRKGYRDENRVTGNLAFGCFVHFTARPVDGTSDPHLHAHCFVHNLTFDAIEQQWKAGQFRSLKERAPQFEALFHARLADRLADLGLPIEQNKRGWELAGIDKALISKFSRRSRYIENKAQAMGITDPVAKSELGAKTREHKRNDLAFRDLQVIWRRRMTPSERRALAMLKAKLAGDSKPNGDARSDTATFIDDTLRRQAFLADWSKLWAPSGWRLTARQGL